VTEYRCPKCDRLLYKYVFHEQASFAIEIKCRCGLLATLTEKPSAVYVLGENAMSVGQAVVTR
jgi:hypothetical protein